MVFARCKDLKSDVDMQGEEDAMVSLSSSFKDNLPSIGRWPKLAISKGSDAASLARGCRHQRDGLRAQKAVFHAFATSLAFPLTLWHGIRAGSLRMWVFRGA